MLWWRLTRRDVFGLDEDDAVAGGALVLVLAAVTVLLLLAIPLALPLMPSSSNAAPRAMARSTLGPLRPVDCMGPTMEGRAVSTASLDPARPGVDGLAVPLSFARGSDVLVSLCSAV